jgi:hypothetical protein
MSKEMNVKCYIDDKEVDCKELQLFSPQHPDSIEEQLKSLDDDYYKSYTKGRGSDA